MGINKYSCTAAALPGCQADMRVDDTWARTSMYAYNTGGQASRAKGLETRPESGKWFETRPENANHVALRYGHAKRRM